MSIETNDHCGNGEIIEHKKHISEHLCPKCKLEDMKPKYFYEEQLIPFNRFIENNLKFVRNDKYYNDDKVTKEHIVWTCPECGYKIAKSC